MMALPFGLSPAAAAFLATAVFAAAFVRGYSGFGFSALVVAAAALVANPLQFVAVATVWEMLMSVQAWRGVWRDVDWQRVGLLSGGAAIGLPLGLWALTSVAEDAARAAISAYVLLMCAVLIAGWRMRGEAGRGATAAVGVVSGVANAPGMGGLPVAAFFAAQPMRAQVFRATLVAYFPLLDLYSAPLYWWHGLITWGTGVAVVAGLPLVLAGNWLGGRHFFHTDPQEFRRFAILLLAALSALGLLKSVM